MKLQFRHSGKQFFFITIAIEGRVPALSRLVDERSRPALLPCGEAVKSLLVAMHGCFPCVTISDFVIMPDHLHFLMIVDYSKEPAFSPLWAAHRLMDAAEMLWGRHGGTAPEAPAALAKAVAIARQNQGNLSIGNRGSGAPEPPSLPRWNRHCYIELSFNARQLKAIRRYIRLNPARALWKARHPDRFIRFANIRHPVLDPARRWDAMGNLTLLASPFLYHVRPPCARPRKSTPPKSTASWSEPCAASCQ